MDGHERRRGGYGAALLSVLLALLAGCASPPGPGSDRLTVLTELARDSISFPQFLGDTHAVVWMETQSYGSDSTRYVARIVEEDGQRHEVSLHARVRYEGYSLRGDGGFVVQPVAMTSPEPPGGHLGVQNLLASPDGATLMYTVALGPREEGWPTHEVWTVGRDGTGARRVARGGEGAFAEAQTLWARALSPDGRRLLLHVGLRDSLDTYVPRPAIYMLDLPSGAAAPWPTASYTHTPHTFVVGFLPDGRVLMHERDLREQGSRDTIVALDEEGRREVLVEGPASDGSLSMTALSGDRRFLLYNRTEGSVARSVLHDLATGSDTPLPPTAEGRYGLALSRDGRYVLYVEWVVVEGYAGDAEFTTHVVRGDGSVPRLLVRGFESARALAISADGTRVLLDARAPPGAPEDDPSAPLKHRLYLLRVDG